MTDISSHDINVRPTGPEKVAVGIPAIRTSLGYALAEMSPRRSLQTLLRVNQVGGFDCPSCAWPDPGAGARKHAEFCENGAKAVAWEATRKRVGADFFAAHAVAAGWRQLEWGQIEALSGLSRQQIEEFADDVIAADSVTVCRGLDERRARLPRTADPRRAGTALPA